MGGITTRPVGGSSASVTSSTPAVSTTETTAPQSTESTGGQSAQSTDSSGVSPRDAGIRRSEHRLDGTLREAQVRNSAPPQFETSVQDAVDRGRRAGLSESDATRLRDSLNAIPAERRQPEMDFLNRHVLGSPNADRALRTYTDARAQQERYPNRITDDIVHTLTRGVAEPRTSSSSGREGVLSHQQAQRAMIALSHMPEDHYRRMQHVLSQAGQANGRPVSGADPQMERALILKSLSARTDRLGERDHRPNIMEMSLTMPHPQSYMQQIESYAGDIRGMRRNELARSSTAIDVNSDSRRDALQQTFTHSCGPATAIIARAESDPIYALQVHRNPRLIEGQQMVELENRGGRAVERPGSGGRGISLPGVLNDRASEFTGETYAPHQAPNSVQGRRSRLNEMETALERGADVPLRMEWGNGAGHFVLATDVRGSAGSREFLITDPFTGRTGWFSENSLAEGHTQFPGTGTGRMTAIYLDR